MHARELEIRVGESVGSVSAILRTPNELTAVYAFAHGAGAPMRHRFMEAMAGRLAEQRIATLRYNFPYTEAGRKRPDPPGVLEATVRAAIRQAEEQAGDNLVIAGGKSMGGRMTSQALAKRHEEAVAGLVFFGFPLHQPGRPATERAAHLAEVGVPMLFLQGTRDSLAQIDLIREICASLGQRATLHVVDQADHSFAVPKRTGRTDADVQNELAEAVATWLTRLRP